MKGSENKMNKKVQGSSKV